MEFVQYSKPDLPPDLIPEFHQSLDNWIFLNLVTVHVNDIHLLSSNYFILLIKVSFIHVQMHAYGQVMKHSLVDPQRIITKRKYHVCRVH